MDPDPAKRIEAVRAALEEVATEPVAANWRELVKDAEDAEVAAPTA